MPILAAERSFDLGLMALAEGRHLDAVAAFQRALEVERERHVSRPSARYLSYYGLSLARAGRPAGEAIEACRTAVDQEPAQPVYLLNLGRVYLAAGRRAQALDCFGRGTTLAPDYRPLIEELERLERSALSGSARSPAGRPSTRAVQTAWPTRAWRKRSA